MIPPISASASTRCTRRKARLPSTIAHSIPAGPAPTIEDVAVAVLRRLEALRVPAAPRTRPRSRSACSRRSRRDPTSACRCCSRCTRGSRRAVLPRSSAAGTGRRSAAAAPITSQAPLRTISAIRSGSVIRETPTIGFAVASRTRLSIRAASPAGRSGCARVFDDHRGADRHVPEVDKVVGEAYELEPLVQVDAVRAERRDRDPRSDGELASDACSDHLQELEPEARPVLERAAVLVRAPVVERREELHGQVAVRAVDVDDVEPGLARPSRRRGPVGLHAPDVVALHRLRRHEQVVARELGGPIAGLASRRGQCAPSGGARRLRGPRARAPRRT